MTFPDPKGAFPGKERSRLLGMYPAVVVDVVDPDAQGRVKLRFPWLPVDDAAEPWARLSTLMAGADRGTWFIPEVDDEVLVAFLAGDPRHPIVVGALWNGQDAPPETMDGAGDNNIRSITSRSGHVLTFDDSSGAEKVVVESQGGHIIELDDGTSQVKLTHSGGQTITMDAAGNIAISATAQVTVDAPAGMTVTAAMVTVDAALSKFSGVVQCDTLITNTVVSATYTPGAGNVW